MASTNKKATLLGAELFGDSSDDSGNDTDEAIAKSKNKIRKISTPKAPKAATVKKAVVVKKKDENIPDADDDSDGDGDGGSSDDGGDGGKSESEGSAFDSDSEGEEEEEKKRKKRREKLEKLSAKKKKASDAKKPKKAKATKASSRPKRGSSHPSNPSSTSALEKSNASSGDEYDSGEEEVADQDDDNFLDLDDDDEDTVNDYKNQKQNFDDDRPEGYVKKVKKSKSKKRERDDGNGDSSVKADPDSANPMMQAVNRMKHSKIAVLTPDEKETIGVAFLKSMETALALDLDLIRQGRPGINRVRLLPTVVATLSKKDLHRTLLDLDLCSVVKRWIQPLAHNKLGTITIRQNLLEALSKVTGENGVSSSDLKRSDLGKVCMNLLNHPDETPAMKRQIKALIVQWQRPVFNKSGSYRDLKASQGTGGGAGAGGGGGMGMMLSSSSSSSSVTVKSKEEDDSDVNSLISNGYKSEASNSNRVSIPYSKGFQYSVRPSDKTDEETERYMRNSRPKEKMDALQKRMLGKMKPTMKNGRSSNVAVCGKGGDK